MIDARGGTVLPGLIDAHCHAYGIELNMLVTESQPLSYVALPAARRLACLRWPAGSPPSATRPVATPAWPGRSPRD